jgi:hypothetical protein
MVLEHTEFSFSFLLLLAYMKPEKLEGLGVAIQKEGTKEKL